ncbi:hypothetical protein D9M68_992430 [compost metagenome]
MAQATVVAEVHQALDVHRNVTAKVTFHDIVAVDRFTDLDHFGVGQFIDATLGRNTDRGSDIMGELLADPVNVLQRDYNALVRRDIDASNTSHVCSPSLNTRHRGGCL